MPDFTREQLQAIESRDGTILVSAAAGSGKTTVLVERVIRRLEDAENPCSADRLLIVTFTKAATAQMKEKIAAALDKRIADDPDNEHLLKQRMLLPFAHISTIDSFCADIVRENFHELGISPDFKMIDETELSVMKSDAVDKVISEAYKENSDSFRNLLDLFVTGSDDSLLADTILTIFQNSRAFPFPDRWLNSLLGPYADFKSPEESVWGKVIIDYMGDMVDYCCKLTHQVLDSYAPVDAIVNESYSDIFRSILSYLENFKIILDGGTWDQICEYIKAFKVDSLPSVSSKNATIYSLSAKTIKSEISDVFKKKMTKLIVCDEVEFYQDIRYLSPIVLEIVKLVKKFSSEFKALKTAGDGVDFNDIVEYTLSLLIEDVDDDGSPVKTPLAYKISEQFDEILVDEFQDINETQNMLFKAVSKNESNLFMVGDVKQSIYRFRQAMPDIFLKKKNSFDPYSDNNYPAKICLDYNFRSRKGVTDFVNFLFTQLMSKKAGELDYNEEETLKPMASYPEDERPDTQVHIIKSVNKKVDRIFEAEYIADYIKDCIKNKLQVKDGDIQRPATYKDFCILIRSAKNKAEIYSSVLTAAGIPCYVSNKNGFFDAPEIRTAIALMKTVDNPLQDIPLVSSLLSPVFGFTPDDLAKLRIDSKGTSIYSCVRKGAENKNKKCIAFMSELQRLRTLSATLGSGEFVSELLDSTGYDAYVCAMPDGAQRNANLNLLLDYARKYEASGHIGISEFIRFLDRIEKQKGDLEVANNISESADVVRVMSIHKSKGLEFPICILADCATKFNDKELSKNVILNPEYGIGFKRIEGYKKYETLPQKAVQLAEIRATRSEELRVLYVALTRAKEKLLIVIRDDNPDKRILSYGGLALKEKRIPPYRVLSSASMAEWILSASVKNIYFFNTIDKLPVDSIFSDSPVEFLVSYVDSSEDESKKDTDEPETDEKLLALLNERLSFKYPYGNLSSIVAKVSPSHLDSDEDSFSYFAKSKPAFLLEEGMSPASKGTAVHKFMEFFDYASDDNPEVQAERMVKDKKLSQGEKKILDFSKLNSFFKSDIACEIKKSPRLIREKKVTVSAPAKDFYPDIQSDDEKIIVQGYIDCAFIKDGKWVIVDYKTDKVDSGETLKSRYYNQLKMYEKALFECTGIEVSSTVIYSLHLGEEIKL